MQASSRERRTKAADIEQLIRQDEGPHLEFKSTARVNLHTDEPDEKIRQSFVKTVAAFLNTAGGVLLIGGSDDGDAIGVDKDIKATNRSRDKYLLYLRDSLGGALGKSVVTGYVDIELVEIDSKTVCKITVEANREGIWCDECGTDAFYVRNGNQTVKLRNREVSEYLRTRKV